MRSVAVSGRFYACMAAICLALAGCKDQQHTAAESVPLTEQQVEAVAANLESVHDQVELPGTIVSVYRAEIAAKVSGTITLLPVVLGSEVQQDDLLIEISAGEIDAKLQQVRAQQAQARRNLEREKKLLKRNAATPENVKNLEDTLRIAEAAFSEAQTIQGYTKILAPFNGRITRKNVSVGDLATPGKPLLNIEDEKHLQVITDIPEALLLKTKAGDNLLVSVPAAGLSIPGIVAEVAPTADPMTRSAPVKLDITAHPNLRPGQFARVAISSEVAKTLTIPAKAIVPLGQMERVFVIEDNMARLRLVRSGANYGDNIEILSGIQVGDKVITQGQQGLRDGQPVKLK